MASNAEPRRGPIRLLIVDRHAMVARGLASALSQLPDVEVLATAATLAEGMALAREFFPDVVLVDPDLTDGNVASSAAGLRHAAPSAALLVLAGHLTEQLAARSLSAGASGALEKSSDLPVLARAIRHSLGARPVVPRRMLPGVLRRLRDEHHPGAFQLTARERQVLDLLDTGLDAASIAERLFISRNTARNYVQNVLVKLGAHSKVEALAIARREGLL
jgi:DNA-binding NarL/FixJ family response regulator